jgi:hypothetical protein
MIMNQQIIFILLSIFFCSALSAQDSDTYYWENGEKIYLEEIPTKKYITVYPAEDTLRVKNWLASEGVRMVCPFKIENSSLLPNFPPIYYSFIEGESFPDLTRDGAVLYVAPFYKRSTFPDYEYVLTDLFCLKTYFDYDVNHFFYLILFWSEQNFVHYLDGWDDSFLLCTRYSNGNALQMANLLYESNLFPGEDVFPVFHRIRIHPSKIPSLLPGQDVSVYTLSDSSGDIVIETKEDLINSVKVTDLSGKTVFSSTYPDVTTVHLDKATKQGIYIVSVRLKSGQTVRNKIVLN